MRNKNICPVLLLLLFSFTKLHAQTASGAPDPTGATAIGSTLGLQQAVNIAIKNNLLVNQSDIALQTSKVGYNQSWDNLLPNVSANASQGIGFGRSLITSSYTYTTAQTTSGSYGLNASLLLFQGLRLENIIRANKFAYSASKLDLEQQKYNITLSVLLAYLQVLSSQDLLAIAREQADVDSKQLDRLTEQNKEGALLLLSDLTDLRGQYANDQANIAQSVNNLETAKINLFNILNVPYKREVEYDRSAFTLEIKDYESPPDSVFQTALQTQPSIRSADLRIKQYQAALSASRGAYWPQLSFYTNVTSYYSNAASPTVIPTNSFQDVATGNIVNVGGTNYNVVAPHQQVVNFQNPTWNDQFKNNRNTGLGLQLNINILNGLQARNNVQQAKINLKNWQINSNSTRLLLQQNVELSYQNMISAYKQYKAFIDQAAAYQESLRTTTIRFNEGVINSQLYLLAKNKSDAANVSLSQAKYTYILRTKVLDFYQGKLTW